ncbi:G patch domain-containing protein 11 [Asparagus officinalis]|nr:G patch domain-containing protein 11 [Asparagus officinalis]XP_020259454.1 G patch domain-containing protein 11 [Asparagus officinalis]XP_020259505.1 G patch domain-containing protein 11 [Asparagus officinalis]XP_020259551.1 G patch domain-containing protein 11 [Asparagus officinalis]
MAGNENACDGEEDYMGDLSLFLPPEVSTSSSSSTSKKKPLVKTQPPQIPKAKKLKGLNWQERRKLEREQKQREEDERTLAGLESAIPESNIGFKMLKNMGYNPGSALGKGGVGRSEPVGLDIRRSREGIGTREEAKRTERVKEVRQRRNEEELMEEFGSRKKNQWRNKRIFWDYKKAEGALAQLENREIVEPEKDANDEEKVEEEQEEEEITEEDLNDILMKLRVEHRYCLYCGCQYESAEALEVNCPGLYEDDH